MAGDQVPRAADEETPLLRDTTQDAKTPNVDSNKSVYDRFTKKQKNAIVAVIALGGLAPFLIAGSFIPSIPQIAEDLETTGEVVSFAVGLAVGTSSFGSLILSSYSGYYGRRPITLVCFIIQCLGSLGIATAWNVTGLLSWRVVQAFGTSIGMSLGLAIIGDIYRVEERGAASGIYVGSILLGPVMAPVIGGTVAHYGSWRVMQFGLSVYSLICVIAVYFFLPETSQPGSRGIEKAREKGENPRFVLLNPLRGLLLLKSPNILFIALVCSFAVMADFTLIVPISFTVGKTFNITNEAVIGAMCIPIGIGNCLGAPISGMISDRTVIRLREKRGGVYVPEDRLWAGLLGSGVFLPCALIGAALVMHFVEGTLGLVLIGFCLLSAGLGVVFTMNPLTAYAVDILHDRSAEVMGAMSSLRGLFLAGYVAVLLPSINKFGILPTYTTVAAVVWVGFGLLVTTIKFGDRMRRMVDLKFTTSGHD
ncbi:MFS general substrate transporter [Trametopsis cervina]|nr:MFS general substrate transporter [Trametopsis cervina]